MAGSTIGSSTLKLMPHFSSSEEAPDASVRSGSIIPMRRRELIVGVGAVAIFRPCAARAQQKALPVIGFLSTRSPEDSSVQMAGFRQGLAEMGYIEGENLAIEYRWARGDYERLPALAADLVGKPVRVLATVGGEPSALAAKAATSTIPIVFSMGDPVQAGLVESYNGPGGNITGIDIVSTELEAKRIGLLHDLVPQAATIGFLVNPAYSWAKAQQRAVEEAKAQQRAVEEAKAQQRAVEEAAHTLKLQVQVLILGANSDGEIEKAFEAAVQQHIGALAIGNAPFFDTRRAKLLALQSQYRLPTRFANTPSKAE
jgi:putative ABC transport system substrate-binding protein